MLDAEREHAVGSNSYSNNIVNSNVKFDNPQNSQFFIPPPNPASNNMNYLDKTEPRPSTSADKGQDKRPVWRDSNNDVILQNVPVNRQLFALDITADEW